MMPLLCSLGQHSALEATQEELREDEVVCAFLDDIYVVTPDPHDIGPIYTTLQQHLYTYARIRVHGGKTQVWNRAGIRPRGCEALERIAQLRDSDARVWRGGGDTDVLPTQQGIIVLGTPLGDAAFIQAHLEIKATEQRTLLDRIPLMSDLQSAWLILLHCASARANYLLRVVEPQAVAEYARTHDDNIWGCLCLLLNVNPGQREDIRSSANLPLVLGGVGLRSASRISASAYWASWADCLPMVFARHRGTPTPHFGGQRQLARGHWSAQWVLTPHLGRLSAKECVPGHWNQMRWSQALLEEGGNTKQRQGWSATSDRKSSSNVWDQETGRFFSHKVVLVLGWH